MLLFLFWLLESSGWDTLNGYTLKTASSNTAVAPQCNALWNKNYFLTLLDGCVSISSKLKEFLLEAGMSFHKMHEAEETYKTWKV